MFGCLVWYGGFLFMIMAGVAWYCVFVDSVGLVLGNEFVVVEFLVIVL